MNKQTKQTELEATKEKNAEKELPARHSKLYNVECIDCEEKKDEVVFYNPREKIEAQLRAGYRCKDCSDNRRAYYRNRRR